MNMYVVKNLYGINIPVLYTKLWFTEKVGHWTMQCKLPCSKFRHIICSEKKMDIHAYIWLKPHALKNIPLILT